MKHIGKIIALSGVMMLLSVGAYASDINVIAPKKGVVSHTSIGEGANDYEITSLSPQNGEGAVITKSGSLLLFGDGNIESITVNSSDGTKTITVHDSVKSDFDEVTSPYIKAKTAEKEGKVYAAATANDNLSVDLSDFSVAKGTVNVEFDMLLEKAAKTNLISVLDNDRSVFSEAQLRFRYDDSVYVAYKMDRYNYTPLRNKLLPTQTWVHIEAVIDMDEQTMSLTAGDNVLYEDAPFIATPDSIAGIKIGTGADNIVIYTGDIVETAQLKIPSETIAVNTADGAMVNVPLTAQIKLDDSFEDILPEYLSWNVAENAVCTVSQTGMLTVDCASLTQSTVVGAQCALPLGSDVVTASGIVTLVPNGTQGTAVAEAAIGGVSLSKTSGIQSGDILSVSVPIYNPTTEQKIYYIVTALQNTGGKNVENYVFKIVAAAQSDRAVYTYDMNVTSGNNLSAAVFVLDESFSINVLKQ